MLNKIKGFFVGKSDEEIKFAIHNKINSVYRVFKESFISKIDFYINDKSSNKFKNKINELEKKIEENLTSKEKEYKKEFYNYYNNEIKFIKEDFKNYIKAEKSSLENYEQNNIYAELMNISSINNNTILNLENDN